nr:hypothetical protein [Oceanococcus sp. HetDA_MAG_MS8]
MRHSPICVWLLLAGCVSSSHAVQGEASTADCRSVVEHTMAEMELADPQWSEERAAIARQAAASACMKALRRLAAAESGTAEQPQAVQDQDDNMGTFLGMPRNKQSGGLHGKPYERRR